VPVTALFPATLEAPPTVLFPLAEASVRRLHAPPSQVMSSKDLPAAINAASQS
jgi:hypothetical protein